MRAALEGGRPIEMLVNNAGTLLEDHPDAREETLPDFERVLEVNLVGLFGLTQLVAREVTAQRTGGSIVNIGSMFGLVAGRGAASYVASKGAVHALTRELAVQWAASGIRVNAIAPGYFPSELTPHIFGSGNGQAMLRRTVTLRRGGRPEELLCPSSSSAPTPRATAPARSSPSTAGIRRCDRRGPTRASRLRIHPPAETVSFSRPIPGS